MELADILSSLRRRWRIAVGMLLLTGAVLAAFYVTRKEEQPVPRYRAQADLLVPKRDEDGNFPDGVPPSLFFGQAALAVSQSVKTQALANAGVPAAIEPSIGWGTARTSRATSPRSPSPPTNPTPPARSRSAGRTPTSMPAATSPPAAPRTARSGPSGACRSSTSGSSRRRRRCRPSTSRVTSLTPGNVPPELSIDGALLVYERADVLARIEAGRVKYASDSGNALLPGTYASVVEVPAVANITASGGLALDADARHHRHRPPARARAPRPDRPHGPHDPRRQDRDRRVLGAGAVVDPRNDQGQDRRVRQTGNGAGGRIPRARGHERRDRQAAAFDRRHVPARRRAGRRRRELRGRPRRPRRARRARAGHRPATPGSPAARARSTDNGHTSSTFPELLELAYSGSLNGNAPQYLQPTQIENLWVLPPGVTDIDVSTDGLAADAAGVRVGEHRRHGDRGARAAPGPEHDDLRLDDAQRPLGDGDRRDHRRTGARRRVRLALAGVTPFGVAMVDQES